MQDYYNTPVINPEVLLEVLPTLIKLDLPAFLSGSVGIGKSETVEQLAKNMNCKVTTRMLSQMQSCDFIIPYVKDGVTKWALADFLADLPQDEPHILFFDEFNAASPDVQIASYQILLSKSIAGFKLPKQTYVIAAGNKISDGALGNQINTALSDRLVHFNIDTNPECWIDWAINNKVNPSVTAFIKAKPQFLSPNLEKDILVHTSPRSWYRVSEIMNVTTNKKIQEILISGVVGAEIAGIFIATMKQLDGLYPVQDYLAATETQLANMLPKTITAYYGLIYSFIGFCKDHEDVMKCILCFFKILEIAQLKNKDNSSIPSQELKIVMIQAMTKTILKKKNFSSAFTRLPEFSSVIFPFISSVPLLSKLKF